MARHIGEMNGSSLPKHIADDAREHHQKYRRELEKACEQRAVLPILQSVRPQHPLHVGLVGTPIPDAENGITKQNGQPGELIEMTLTVDDRLQHVQLPGSNRLLEAGQVMHTDPW